MRRRPQPNRRRGLLRAAGVVIVLVLLLVGAILLVSSLTAPTARAPTVPPTPGPIRPTPARTATTHRGTPAPLRPQPRPTARATTKPLSDASSSPAGEAMYVDRTTTPAASRRAWFTGTGDAYHGRLLLLGGPLPHRAVRVDYADPYVRPVLSADGRYVLYVTVTATRDFPGALWSLWRFDSRARARRLLVRMTGMGLAPLGWTGDRILFMRATASDTDLYAVSGHAARFISILITQPVTAARLSPDGRWIAFAAPASCVYCTLDIFNVVDAGLWNGPSGLPSDEAITWTDDSAAVVVQLGHQLAAISPDSHDVRRFSPQANLADLWQHEVRARLLAGALRLHDELSGVTVTASAAAETH